MTKEKVSKTPRTTTTTTVDERNEQGQVVKGEPQVEITPGESVELEQDSFSKVGLTLGMTKSLGAGTFEFARIDISMEDYCESTPEARKDKLQALYKETSAIMAPIVQKIVDSRKK